MNHFYGYCASGMGCFANSNSTPAYGTCENLTSCNTWTAGCLNNLTCANMCVDAGCGDNATMWWYDNFTGSLKQKSYGNATCLTGDYHCEKGIGKTYGTCKDHKRSEEKLYGGLGICLLFLLIICCCCCCCAHHHKKMKEEEAMHEAMLAQEQAQASSAVMGE